MKVQVIIDVDPELADEHDVTGMTEDGYNQLMEALSGIGTVDDGPIAVGA